MFEKFYSTPLRAILSFMGVALICALMIASCTPAPVAQPVAYQQPQVVQPQVVQQVPQVVAAPAPVVVQQGHSGFGDAFAGSMMGSMVGNMMSGPRHSTTVVEHHTTTVVPQRPTVTTTAPAQRYAAPAVAPRPTFTAPARPPVARTVTTTPSGRTSISVGKSRR